MRVVYENSRVVARFGLSKVIKVEVEPAVDEEPLGRGASRARELECKPRLPVPAVCLDDNCTPVLRQEPLELIHVVGTTLKWRREHPALMEELLELAEIKEEPRTGRGQVQELSPQIEVLAQMHLGDEPP